MRMRQSLSRRCLVVGGRGEHGVDLLCDGGVGERGRLVCDDLVVVQRDIVPRQGRRLAHAKVLRRAQRTEHFLRVQDCEELPQTRSVQWRGCGVRVKTTVKPMGFYPKIEDIPS